MSLHHRQTKKIRKKTGEMVRKQRKKFVPLLRRKMTNRFRVQINFSVFKSLIGVSLRVQKAASFHDITITTG